MLIAIYAVGFITLNAATSCQSDGCFGLTFFVRILWILTVVEVLVAIPIFAGNASSHGQHVMFKAGMLALSSPVPAVIVGIVIYRRFGSVLL